MMLDSISSLVHDNWLFLVALLLGRGAAVCRRAAGCLAEEGGARLCLAATQTRHQREPNPGTPEIARSMN